MSLKIVSDEDNRERMLRGELYHPMKEGLIQLRAKAKVWCRQYNQTDDDATDFIQVRERLLKGSSQLIEIGRRELPYRRSG